MSKCIYCLKSDQEATFATREHVLPQFFGTFEPINPTIQGDLVCDECNTIIFSPLERNFKEDSEEGVTCQMLNLERKKSVRLRGKNVKMKSINKLDDDFFNEVFPFLRPNASKGCLEVIFEPQVKLKNYNGVYQIFLPEALERLKNKRREFEEIKRQLVGLQKEDIQIFAGSNGQEDRSNLDYIISLLHEYGVTYKEKELKFTNLERASTEKIEIEMDCKIDRDLGRVIAKIAFNYFIYCAKEEENTDILYGNEFDKIRSFIMGDSTIELKEVIKSASMEPILIHEKERGERLICHTIVFLQSDADIIAKATFFGKIVYEIYLGKMPSVLTVPEFGCGHTFDPFTRKILSVVQKQPKTYAGIALSFGLLKRG